FGLKRAEAAARIAALTVGWAIMVVLWCGITVGVFAGAAGFLFGWTDSAMLYGAAIGFLAFVVANIASLAGWLERDIPPPNEWPKDWEMDWPKEWPKDWRKEKHWPKHWPKGWQQKNDWPKDWQND